MHAEWPDTSLGSRLEHALTQAPEATEEIKDGRQVAKVLATNLVEDIARLGLPVELASNAPPTAGPTLGIQGQFLAIDEGNRLRRAVIGLGVGSSEVRALVQLYSTADGQRRLVEDFYTTVKSSRKPGFGPMAGAGAAAGRVAASAAVSGGVGAVTARSQTVEG